GSTNLESIEIKKVSRSLNDSFLDAEVDNLDRLVGNLCTLWLGRMHLQANIVRYERVSTPPHKPFVPSKPVGASSYASALKGTPNTLSYSDPVPAIILEDSCLVMRDFDNFVMGEIKEFSAINNLRLLLANEGFTNVKLSYLGGLWVMIELDSTSTKAKFMQHVGVASWFVRLCNAQADFVSRERIVWVDIEGVPLHAWSQSTFKKIGAKWGEVMDLEESKDDMFARKHICVNAKQEDNILERFKIIARGKVFVIRAKELFMWSPIFKEPTDSVYGSDNESVEGDQEVNENGNAHGNLEGEGDNEAVSDTFFGDSIDHNNGLQEHTNFSAAKEAQAVDDASSPIMSASKKKSKTGGSILGLLDELIRVGNTIGYSMDGCAKDLENIIGFQGELIWGNYSFDYLHSEALGNSGGILCAWDSNIFQKTHHTISVNFVAVYGTWIPSKSKLLLISIYVPQSETDKRVLWSFCSDIINCWDGECVVMGDFNEVRVEGERMGSVFSVRGARDFNNFISSVGLVDIQLEGYSFTWSHPSATKMSKLDRFLILKKGIRSWVSNYKKDQSRVVGDFKKQLHDVDIVLDQGGVNDDLLLARKDLVKSIQEFQSSEACDYAQKAKVQWAIEGDENSKFYHGIINRKCSQLSIKGIMVDGVWVDDPPLVKDEFRSHFAKSSFAKGCNSSFIALIPKAPDVKFVSEYQPISLIGCLYKVVTKILATRLSNVISDLVADVQTAFLPNWQILDGPFIINEVLSWCKSKQQHAMVFKVDFDKAYDSVRWDFLDDVLDAFGFGAKWRSWVFGSLSSCTTSIIINGTPTAEFKFYYGLKQGDPLAPYLFILIMESLHLSFSKVVDAGLFKGIKIDPSTQISHLFYANDAVLLVNGLIITSKHGGLGVSSFFALNRALLFKWGWRFISYENSLWSRVIHAIHGPCLMQSPPRFASVWGTIVREVQALKSQGVDLLSYCRIHVGNGLQTSFWKDHWIGESPLCTLFPRVFLLETSGDITVVDKMHGLLSDSFRRSVRGGIEAHQLAQLQDLVGTSILSTSADQWVCNLSGDGTFHVKNIRCLLDEFFLPNDSVATRWVKFIPIKINMFAWRVFLDRLPTRMNLCRRNIQVPDLSCPVCKNVDEE
nr:RNA-directed DNA polymerase, eukaryota [Tanacetum cinerariifolium]